MTRPNSINRRFGIAKKIGYGYAVVIVIAVCGIGAGLTFGDYYQKKSQERLILAHRQHILIQELENAVFQVRLHPQQLMTVLGDSLWFEYEINQFKSHVLEAQTLIDELEGFISNDETDIVVDTYSFQSVLHSYQQTIEGYDRLMTELWGNFDPLRLSEEELPAAQHLVLNRVNQTDFKHLRVQLERNSERLTRIAQRASRQAKEANLQLLAANQLRLRVIIASLLLFTSLAAWLAWRTSRAIAQPVEKVTQLAQRVVQEGNFHLRSHVCSQDEVEMLAMALNQLIQWMGDYTEQLQESQETLEERVQERTQELQKTLQNLKSTQAQLIQSEKMSSLGQMVAGVAHEINNPINFIHGNLLHLEQYSKSLFDLITYYQEKYPDSDPELDELIEDSDFYFIQQDFPQIIHSMKMGSSRIKNIIISLRNFSRLDEAAMKEVDIHDGLENTLMVLNNKLHQKVEIIKNYVKLPRILCYPAQLNQVFMNIISNAVDALDEARIIGKKIWITTEKTADNWIKIHIKDNGNGISPELQAKLFDPFFTTKPVGKGTGLGLTVCYQIIEQHHGRIEVVSEVGSGTEFVISLPFAPG
ncbi:HAMP domain-containing protein [Spirulina subsalsa FACHB-351]|uniref:histidine kinase n=1 Tax=Spirulina subsalsa FACHB-351 TaxID=234711 RepID=A0ABT3L5Z2_9CYAN|nr:ATP-binding protein [Spirulina subsalsa]MCW6036913.1 HAMP domain-containing protein [Spirulina subsalsa FACHB-351]